MSTPKESSNTKKVYQEIITPHRLAIAILIENFCQYRETDFLSDKNKSIGCKYRRDFCVLCLKLIQSPDLSLSEFRSLLRSEKYSIPVPVIESFDNALAKLSKSGIGDMLDVIDSFNRILTFNEGPPDPNKSFITKNSVVGYYLRRLLVSFDKLSFSEVTSVYSAFNSYYKSGEQSEIGKIQDQWVSSTELWSKRQAELFIATQAALLANNEEKALPPPELQMKISSLIKSDHNIAEAHFLSYLNYLRVKEYCCAIDSLYHCFDKNVVSSTNKPFDEKIKGNRFAALNLAILHYHFGYFECALASLKEAIKLSQLANDNICLQHALFWLSRLTTNNRDKLIVHCITKSVELSLSYTTTLGLQTIGQYGCLISGDPYSIFETLTKSDIINCQCNFHDLISNSHALKSALWQFYGKTEMSSLWSQLLHYLNVDCNSPNKAYYGEGFCLSVCNVANILCSQGDYNLAFVVLDFIKRTYPKEPHSHIWMLSENLLIFHRSLYQEKWKDAENAAKKIMVVDKWEGYLRVAQVHFYQENFQEATDCLNTLIKAYEEEEKGKEKHYYHIRAKVMLCEVQFASCYPHSIPNSLLTILNKCLIETKKAKLDYETSLINLNIANVLLALGLTKQALKVMDRCLVQILAHGGCYDRARAVLLFVKCLLADSTDAALETREKVIKNCCEQLDGVKEDFERVEAFTRVKNVLFLQGHLYNQIKLIPERNKCAMEFRLLEEQHESKNKNFLLKYV